MKRRSLLERVRLLGVSGLAVLQAMGRAVLFLGHALIGRSGTRNGFALLVKQLYGVGVLSLPIIIVAGVFIGMVLALQGYSILVDYGSAQAVGQMVALREQHGVYGTDKGRICVAALNEANIDHVCAAIAEVRRA